MPRTASRTAFAGTLESSVALKTYVVDTSVLLSDPHALRNFAEHTVIVPVVVITELEAKRHHPELGYFARTALRYLDDLRLAGQFGAHHRHQPFRRDVAFMAGHLLQGGEL